MNFKSTYDYEDFDNGNYVEKSPPKLAAWIFTFLII